MMVVFVVEIRAMMIMVLMDEDDKETNTVFGLRLVIVLSFMNNFTLRYWEMLKKSSHTWLNKGRFHGKRLPFFWILSK